MKEAAEPLFPSHRSVIRKDNLISFILFFPGFQLFLKMLILKSTALSFFIPKVKNTPHTCKLAVSCVFKNVFRFAVGQITPFWHPGFSMFRWMGRKAVEEEQN